MHSWLSDVHERTRWHYYPCRLAPRRFEPEFGYWVPVDAGIGLRALTRNEFRKEATRQFHQQLEKYCRQVEAEWGVRKAECGQLALHARWTAQYKRGMSILEICTGLRRYRDPEQAVRKAIRRFKRAIGVH